MKPADEDTLRELARSVVGRVEGLDLEDVVIVAAGRRSLIRVVVDGDRGISLDAAAEISRSLGAELDAAEAAGTAFVDAEPYTLEVTSPGVGRPLTEERHFRRARGRQLTVTLLDGTRMEGRVRRVVDGTLELLTGTDAAITGIALDRIRRAKVEVEFGAMPPAHTALLDADGFVDPARAFDEVPADAFADDDPDDDDPADDLDELDDDDLDDGDPAGAAVAGPPSDAAPTTTTRTTGTTEEGPQ